MVKGFCSVCGKEVGTFFKPAGYQCRSCFNIFCFDCSRKIGFIFKKPVCPNCGIELVDDVKKEELREIRVRSRQTGYGIEEGKRMAVEDARQRQLMEAERRRRMKNLDSLIFGKPQKKRKKKK